MFRWSCRRRDKNVAVEVHEVFRSGKSRAPRRRHRAIPAQRFPGLESASAWCEIGPCAILISSTESATPQRRNMGGPTSRKFRDALALSRQPGTPSQRQFGPRPTRQLRRANRSRRLTNQDADLGWLHRSIMFQGPIDSHREGIDLSPARTSRKASSYPPALGPRIGHDRR